MTHTKERKRFKDLNLLDRFLFAEAMEDSQNIAVVKRFRNYIEKSVSSKRISKWRRNLCRRGKKKY